MKKLLLFKLLVVVTVSFFMSAGESVAITFSKQAHVRIIEQPHGIWPIGNRPPYPPGIDKPKHNNIAAGYSGKAAFVARVLKKRDYSEEQGIIGQYIIPSLTSEHIQFSFKDLQSSTADVKFTSIKLNKKSEEDSAITLATVVHVPANLPAGVYNPALQIAAHYE